jgi:hypothetical protein
MAKGSQIERDRRAKQERRKEQAFETAGAVMAANLADLCRPVWRRDVGGRELTVEEFKIVFGLTLIGLFPNISVKISEWVVNAAVKLLQDGDE